MVKVLFGAVLQPLLMVRHDLRLSVDALDQSGKKRIPVHDAGGDAIETALLEPSQPGHHGNVTDRELRQHNKQHHQGSMPASLEHILGRCCMQGRIQSVQLKRQPRIVGEKPRYDCRRDLVVLTLSIPG